MTRIPPYTTRSGLKIGSMYDPTRRHTQTWSETQIQDALLSWARRSANDSQIESQYGSFDPLHEANAREHARRFAEREQRRKSKKLKRVVHKALRGVVSLFLSRESPRITR